MPLTSRKKILDKLRKKYRGSTNYASPVFNFLKKPETPFLKAVEERINGLNGKFIYCRSTAELQEKLIQFLSQRSCGEITCTEENISNMLPEGIPVVSQFSEKSDIAVTGCEYLVAQTGSIIISTAQSHSRRIFAYPATHLVIVRKDQLIEELSVAVSKLAEKYQGNFPSQITVITGPSRTADIEKTLVMGAHGPKELIIFYLDE